MQTVRRFSAVFLAVALSVCATGAQAVSFGIDDRREVERRPGSLAGPIGALYLADGKGAVSAGTGFLVSPCHVLTARHVLSRGISDGEISNETAAEFYLGTGNIGPEVEGWQVFAVGAVAHPVIWGRDEAGEENGWNDWALLKLDTCLGSAAFGYGYLELKAMTTRSLMRGGEAIVATAIGLPSDRPVDTLWQDPECRVLGQLYRSGWQHDCVSATGNSGGPILEIENGRARVIAINTRKSGIDGMPVERSESLHLKADDPSYYDQLSSSIPVAVFLKETLPYLPGDPALRTFVTRHDGDQHYSYEDAERAVADIDAAIAEHGDTTDRVVLRGLWHEVQRDRKSAIRDFALAEQLAPSSDAIKFLIMRNAVAVADAKVLEDIYHRLDMMSLEYPETPAVRELRARVAFRLGRFDLALGDFDTLLKERPASASLAAQRGDIHFALGDYENALGDYSRAVTLDPGWADARMGRGIVHYSLGQCTLADRDFSDALALDSRQVRALAGRARARLALGRLDGVISDVDQALTLAPDLAPVIAIGAAAEMSRGRWIPAINAWERVLRTDSGNPFNHLMLFVARARAGLLEQAERGLSDVMDRLAFDAWPRPVFDLFLGRDNAKGRLGELAEAGTGGPAGRLGALQADFFLGQWALVQGDRDEAIRRLEAVIATGWRDSLEFDIALADLVDLGVMPAKGIPCQ